MGDRRETQRLIETNRRRWTAGDARRVMEACRASGLSMAVFAARHGLSAQRLSWWKARLRDWAKDESRSSAGPVARLVPAVVHGGPEVAQAVLRLPGGMAVEVRDTVAVSPRWVAAVVVELTGRR